MFKHRNTSLSYRCIGDLKSKYLVEIQLNRLSVTLHVEGKCVFMLQALSLLVPGMGLNAL